MPTLTVVGAADEEPAGRKDFPVLSIFDPVFIGIDEFGHPVYVPLMYRNMLVGGEPGSGKSVLLNLVAAHAALDPGCGLVLLDGKWVELGQWRACADVFVGPTIGQAIKVGYDGLIWPHQDGLNWPHPQLLGRFDLAPPGRLELAPL